MADALAETDDSYYVIRMDSVDDKEAAEKKKESILSQRRSEKYDEVLQKYKDDSKWTVHEKEWKKVNFENLYTIKTAEQETAADDGTAGTEEGQSPETGADGGAEPQTAAE